MLVEKELNEVELCINHLTTTLPEILEDLKHERTLSKLKRCILINLLQLGSDAYMRQKNACNGNQDLMAIYNEKLDLISELVNKI